MVKAAEFLSVQHEKKGGKEAKQGFCFTKVILSGSLGCSEPSTMPWSPFKHQLVEGADRFLPSG